MKGLFLVRGVVQGKRIPQISLIPPIGTFLHDHAAKVYGVAQVALGKTDQMMPSLTTTESSVSQPLRCGPGCPRKKRSDVTEVLEISSDEEETKSNAKLSRLMHPPKINHSPQILDEEMEKVIVKVESLLVKKLFASANDVDSMVRQANTTFEYLKGLGVDYGPFYGDVTEYITHCCNLQDAKREETMLSLSALHKKI